jgi:hypothetical protein
LIDFAGQETEGLFRLPANETALDEARRTVERGMRLNTLTTISRAIEYMALQLEDIFD